MLALIQLASPEMQVIHELAAPDQVDLLNASKSIS